MLLFIEKLFTQKHCKCGKHFAHPTFPQKLKCGCPGMLFFTFFPFLRFEFAAVPIYEAYRAIFAAFRFRFSVRRRREFFVLVALLIYFSFFYSETKCTWICLNFLFKLATLISLTFHGKNNRTTSVARLETMNLGRILSRLLNASVITNGNAIIVRSIHVISFLSLASGFFWLDVRSLRLFTRRRKFLFTVESEGLTINWSN